MLLSWNTEFGSWVALADSSSSFFPFAYSGPDITYLLSFCFSLCPLLLFLSFICCLPLPSPWCDHGVATRARVWDWGSWWSVLHFYVILCLRIFFVFVLSLAQFVSIHVYSTTTFFLFLLTFVLSGSLLGTSSSLLEPWFFGKTSLFSDVVISPPPWTCVLLVGLKVPSFDCLVCCSAPFWIFVYIEDSSFCCCIGSVSAVWLICEGVPFLVGFCYLHFSQFSYVVGNLSWSEDYVM